MRDLLSAVRRPTTTTARNAGFRYRELLDARWAGLQFLMLNVYGPDLLAIRIRWQPSGRRSRGPAPTSRSLSSMIPGRGANHRAPPSWQPAPNLSDTEGSAQRIYQAKWKPFFHKIARDYWYLVQNRPFIYFYNAGTLTPANVSAAVVNRMKQLFLQDFGVCLSSRSTAHTSKIRAWSTSPMGASPGTRCDPTRRAGPPWVQPHSIISW